MGENPLCIFAKSMILIIESMEADNYIFAWESTDKSYDLDSNLKWILGEEILLDFEWEKRGKMFCFTKKLLTIFLYKWNSHENHRHAKFKSNPNLDVLWIHYSDFPRGSWGNY